MPTTHAPVVIRFGRLGDTVLLQPLLQKLHRRYGRPCRLLALGAWPQTLYSAQPEVAGCIELCSQYGPLWLHPLRWGRVARALRQLRESPFYICEPHYRARTKVRPLLALAGVPPAQCSFIEDLPIAADEHWVDWLLRFGDTVPAGLRATAPPPSAPSIAAPQLRVSMLERDECARWLGAQGWTGRPLVLLQPANKRTMRWNGVRQFSDDEKAWPAERWAMLARAIGARLPQAQILLCGSAAESGYLATIMAAVGQPALRGGVAAVPLGRLKALLENAHSMVSVDTGPAHLAAAVGCPLVVLFGGRSPLLWAPRRAGGSAVSVLGGLPTIRRVDEIDVGSVIRAWQTLPPRASAATDFRTGARG